MYVVTVALLPQTARLQPGEAAALAIVLVAFWLFSYLASVVARAQRATRDAAIRLSLHDPLTRLHNRSYLFAVMEREIQRARRTGRSFGLLLLDLDGLKPINDTFGHPMGDRVLRAVGEAIRHGIRGIDTGARYGGDEFVVLLPETDLVGAVTLAEKLREAVGAIHIATENQQVRTTVSVGVASFPDDGSSPQALLERADAAMFGSKRSGRDRVSTGFPEAQPTPQPAAQPVPAVGEAGAGTIEPRLAEPRPRPIAPALQPAFAWPWPWPRAPRARSCRAVPGGPAAGRGGPERAPHLRFGGTRAESVLIALSKKPSLARPSPAGPSAAVPSGAGSGTRAVASWPRRRSRRPRAARARQRRPSPRRRRARSIRVPTRCADAAATPVAPFRGRAPGRRRPVRPHDAPLHQRAVAASARREPGRRASRRGALRLTARRAAACAPSRGRAAAGRRCSMTAHGR